MTKIELAGFLQEVMDNYTINGTELSCNDLKEIKSRIDGYLNWEIKNEEQMTIENPRKIKTYWDTMETDYADKYLMSGYKKPVRMHVEHEIPNDWTDEQIIDFCKRKDVTWIKD